MVTLFKKYPFLFLIILALPAALPTLRTDFFSVHDEAQHLVDIYQMFRSLEVGGFPPRWAPDLNFGLGHPYFNFYYHLSFYITSIMMFLGASMADAFKSVMTIVIFTAPLGFYFFASQFLSKPASLVASVLYLYTPYFAVDLYVRGALGELTVLALIPWGFYGLTSLITKPGILHLIISSLVLALLGIAHNVLNIFIFPWIFLYGLALSKFINQFKQRIIFIFLTFSLGLGLASYYWLPALWEKQYISTYEQIKMEDHFPFIKQLLIPSWDWGSSHWGPDDQMSFQIGLINLLAVFLIVIFFKKISDFEKRLAIFFLVMFFTSAVLMNIRTLPFWNLNPLFRYVQFPWRMLIFTTFSSAFIGGLFLNWLFKRFDNKRIVFYTSLAIFCIIVLNVWYFRPSEYKKVSDEKALEAYFANRTTQGERGYLSKDYPGFSEDFLPPTRWTKKRPEDIPKRAVETEKSAELSYIKDGINYYIDINSAESVSLRIYTAYFPGWIAKTNGQSLDTKPATDLGIVSVDVPSGKHTIKLAFEDTLVRKLAKLSSLISLLAIIFLMVRIKRK